MFGIDLLQEGAFFSIGSRAGFKPVRIWIGRIDEPGDLGGNLNEPVLSTIITSLRDGMPFIGHAPFRLSTLLAEPYQKLEPFALETGGFRKKYLSWREDWDDKEATIWDIGPAEVYHEALQYLTGQRKQ